MLTLQAIKAIAKEIYIPCINCPECLEEMTHIENNMDTEVLNVCFDCDITINSDGGTI